MQTSYSKYCICNSMHLRIFIFNSSLLFRCRKWIGALRALWSFSFLPNSELLSISWKRSAKSLKHATAFIVSPINNVFIPECADPPAPNINAVQKETRANTSMLVSSNGNLDGWKSFVNFFSFRENIHVWHTEVRCNSDSVLFAIDPRYIDA